MIKKYSEGDMWRKEQETLKALRAQKPELFKPVQINTNLLKHIGITSVPDELPLGYIRLYPSDFVVEEILQDETLVPVDATPTKTFGEVQGEYRTVYADMVKGAIATIDGITKISEALNIEKSRISFAGMKDAGSFTAQRIAIRDVTVEQVAALDLPDIVLRNIHAGKGAMSIGGLKGNRFTLVVRTDGTFNEAIFKERVEDVIKNGVYNYFGSQRFGKPRYLAHEFGKRILQGDFQGAVRAVLTMPSPFEVGYSALIRKKATAVYGKWKIMHKIFSELPYTFRHERMMLEAIVRTKEGFDPFMYALKCVPKQTELWIYAYGSFLTNKFLSTEARKGQVILEETPLLTSFDPIAREIYGPTLFGDKAERFLDIMMRFKFLHVQDENTIPTIMRPTNLTYKILPHAVVIRFDLPKGSYATTLLNNIFNVRSGIPIPKGIDETVIDSFEMFGTGNLKSMMERFKYDKEFIREEL